MSSYTILLLTPPELIRKPYWPALHAIILRAYEPTRENWPLPKSFQRLEKDVTKAGNALCEELGSEGMVAVAFDNGDPMGCAAIQRFKIIRQGDVDGTAKPVNDSQGVHEEREGDGIERWEINLVTISLEHRGKGIARRLVKELEEFIVNGKGNVRLMVRTVDEISGGYWREKQGFKTLEEYCITLPKGFSHVPDAPEDIRMQRDILLWTGEREIGP